MLQTKQTLPDTTGVPAVPAALGKVASKEMRRDQLRPGGEYAVDLRVTGAVNKAPVDLGLDAIVCVGHDSTRAASRTPQVGRLVAHMLGLLNGRTREKLLRELPELFARSGNQLPEPPAELVAAVDTLLGRLRAKVSQEVSGPVSCRYELFSTDVFAD